MPLGTIALLALALSFDAMVAAAARGVAVPRVLPRHVALVMLAFGGAQAAMPVLGFYAATTLGTWVAEWDHWIAAGLLTAIGGKMIAESARPGEASSPESTDSEPFSILTILLLALATSIDTFAAGITLPVLNAPVILSSASIGATTAGLSALGLLTGRRIASRLGGRLEVAGGFVLIALGLNTLIGHQAP